MQFPGDYPMSPPFVRVVRPRFKFLTGEYALVDSSLYKPGLDKTKKIVSLISSPEPFGSLVKASSICPMSVHYVIFFSIIPFDDQIMHVLTFCQVPLMSCS